MASNFLNSLLSVRAPQGPPPSPSWSAQMQERLSDVRVHGPLSMLGVFMAYAILKWVATVFYLFLRPSSLPKSRHPSGQPYLTWALITGSTDGIGRALAFELSRRGFALVLHGRNPEKLDKLASEIYSAHHKELGAPKPRTIIATADRCRDIDFSALVAPLRTLRLTVLVNNVGAQGHLVDDPFRTLDHYEQEDVERLIDLNAVFMAQLTRELLPVLLRASDPSLPDNAFDYPVKIKSGNARKVGDKAPTAQILNASSAAAVGVPYVTPYAGAKGFIDSFSMALRNEFRAERLPSSRIDVISLRIGNVVTNNHPGAVRLFMPDANTYAKAICERVGCGEHITIPYLWHYLQVNFFANLVGRWAMDLGIIVNMRWVVADHKRILAEREAAGGTAPSEKKAIAKAEDEGEDAEPLPATTPKGRARKRK